MVGFRSVSNFIFSKYMYLLPSAQEHACNEPGDVWDVPSRCHKLLCWFTLDEVVNEVKIFQGGADLQRLCESSSASVADVVGL